MDTLIYKSSVALAVGAILMLALSFTVYRKSYYYKKALAKMTGAATRPGLSSRLVTLGIALSSILYLAATDVWTAAGEPRTLGFLFAFNLSLVAILSLFDALFIDLFLLLIWRPALLRLPDGLPTRDAMLRHVKVQLTMGWLFKVPIAFLAAVLAFTMVNLGS